MELFTYAIFMTDASVASLLCYFTKLIIVHLLRNTVISFVVCEVKRSEFVNYLQNQTAFAVILVLYIEKELVNLFIIP